MPAYTVRARGQWAPLSSQYYFDDAIGEAGEAAELMFLRGLSFSAAARADGFITERQAATVVGMGLDDVERRCKALAGVGLWVPDAERGGYVVRSWLTWNRSTEEIEQYARRDAERKRNGQSKRGPVGSDTSMSDRNPYGVQTESERIPYVRTGQDTVRPELRSGNGQARPSAAEAPPRPPVAGSSNAEIRELREKLSKRPKTVSERPERLDPNPGYQPG